MHVLKFTLCYPPGECHPDALLELPPDDVELSGNYEDYEFLTSDRVPVVGDVQTFDDSGDWLVVALEYYAPDAQSDMTGVYHLICTRDGEPRQRDESDTGYTVLGVKLDGQAIAVREAGTTWADWWVGSELAVFPSSDTWEVLTFSPQGSDTKPSYDRVLLYRPVPVLQTA